MKFCQVVIILGVIVHIEGLSISKIFESKEGDNEIHFLSHNKSVLLAEDYNIENDEENNNVENTTDVYDDIVYEGRIVGGEPTSILKFPHQVSLQLNQKHICGGAIVSTNVVITAAHCVLYPVKSKYYSVRVGSNQHERRGQVVQVRKIIIHQQYGPANNDKDVALLVLSSNLNFTKEIQPVRLPDTEDQLIDGMELLVSGWGVKGSSQLVLPRILHYVAVQLINPNVCRQNYQSIQPITPFMICAGAIGKDSCQGDSGGPLVKSLDGNNTLYGIVSFGIGCARARYPGVYTNVFLITPWIQAHLNLINNNNDFILSSSSS